MRKRPERQAGEASTYILTTQRETERQRESAATTASGYGVLAVTVSLSVMISRANFRLDEAQIDHNPSDHTPTERDLFRRFFWSLNIIL